MSQWFTVQYLCGHISSLRQGTPPDPGDEYVCPRCNRSVNVTWSTGDFRVVCLGCPVRQRFGRGKLAMDYFTDKHMRKYPTHSVRLLQGNQILEVRGASRNLPDQLDLFQNDQELSQNELDEPPY